MMFGSGLPILFPIALFSLILIYVLEKYMLYYVYRLPLKYDGTLYKMAIYHLNRAAIVSFAMGFW